MWKNKKGMISVVVEVEKRLKIVVGKKKIIILKINNKMEIKISQEEFTMDTEYIALEGKHNMKNAMAATSVAKLMQIRKATIRESLSNFQGVEHRLEKVLKIQNVLVL